MYESNLLLGVALDYCSWGNVRVMEMVDYALVLAGFRKVELKRLKGIFGKWS